MNIVWILLLLEKVAWFRQDVPFNEMIWTEFWHCTLPKVNFPIAVNGSCDIPVFVARDGFCYYVNPTLQISYDTAASQCQDYGDGYNLVSILVLCTP